MTTPQNLAILRGPRMKRLLPVLLALGLWAGTGVAARADIPAGVGTYGSSVYATGVHVIVYTEAFPNFSSGAVDNHYPLAKAKQDASPLADAIATFSDVGPGVNTVAACSNPDPSKCPNRDAVPYANAHYPGGKSSDHVDSCSPSAASGSQSNACPSGKAASYADVAAAELKADASGFYAGGGEQPFSGAEADSHTIVNDDGSLVAITHASVHDATFANGAIRITKVEVITRVTTAGGSATADARVTVGQVLINNQPATINDQGVTVQQNQVVPCTAPGPAGQQPLPPPLGPSAPQPPANCLPQVETETFKVFTVSPQKKAEGSHGHVSASGLHVLVTQPSAPGVPNHHVEYVFGEGFADADLGAGGVSGADTGGGELGGAAFGDMGGAYGDSGTGDVSGTSGAAPNAHKAAAVFVGANRRPLALFFVFWECMLLAAAAAWVWARRLRAREVAAAAAEETA